MGQANSRGTREARIESAKAKTAALRPEKIICGKCQAGMTEFQSMDTRSVPGLDAAFAGICPECGQTTWAFKGTRDAVADAMLGIEQATGVEGRIGVQTKSGENIKI